MGTIKGMLRKFEALDTDKLAEEAMSVTEPEFVELNQQQMYSGVRSDETPIFPPYAKLTVEIKTAKGQPTDRVTLKDTGDFYSGMFLRVNGNGLTEDSTDPKSLELQDKYGQKIFGLGGSYKQEYISEFLRPVFIGGIKSETGV